MGKRYDKIRKCAQVRDLVQENQYIRALDLIDTIPLKEVNAIEDLYLFADMYEKAERLDKKKEIYFLIYERTHSRYVLNRLLRLVIRMGDMDEARELFVAYEFAGKVTLDSFELRYLLAKAEGQPRTTLIGILEDLKREEYTEEWGYQLARLYEQEGMREQCIQECKDLKLWFGEGRIIDKAMELKARCEAPGWEPPVDEEIPEPETPEIDEGIAYAADPVGVTDMDAVVESGGIMDERPTEMEIEVGEPDISMMTQVDELKASVRRKLEKLKESGQLQSALLEISGGRQSETLEIPGKRQTETLEIPGGQQPEALEIPGEQQSGTLEIPGEQQSGTLEMPGGQQPEALEVPGGQQSEVLEVSGQVEGMPAATDRGESVSEPVVVKRETPVDSQRHIPFRDAKDALEDEKEDISERGIVYRTLKGTMAHVRRNCEKAHFVFAGGEERIALAVAKRVTKELKHVGYFSAKNIVKIKAEKLNNLELLEQVDKLLGCCMLVTDAPEMTEKTVGDLLALVEGHGNEIVVMLSGAFDETDCFLSIYPSLSEKMPYKVHM